MADLTLTREQWESLADAIDHPRPVPAWLREAVLGTSERDCISLENHVDCCDEASRQQYLQGQRDTLAKAVRALRRRRDEQLRLAREFGSFSSAIYVDEADNARTCAAWLARELKPAESGGQDG